MRLANHNRFVARWVQTVFALLLMTCVAIAADEVVMKNGDRVTGEIIKKDGNTLTIKSVHFGTITLPWAEIETVRTDSPLNVVLEDGDTLQATLEATEGTARIQVEEDTREVPVQEVVALRNEAEQRTYERFLNPGLFDLWTVNGSLNIAGAQGNAETLTITTPLTFARESNTSKTTAYFNAIRSSAQLFGQDERAQTAEAVRGGWAYSRNLSPRFFLNSFNDYEYDKFQSLDLRIVLGGGAGYQLWRSDRGRLDLQGGSAWNREQFNPVDDPVFVRQSAEAYWGNDFRFKLNSRTTITQGFRMFNNLTDGGEYRINFDGGATTKLTQWLTWNISLSNRYLSNPVPGRQPNDLLYTTGLGFTFAR
jgi:putative salt-induced outer membrane protein YdiY